MPSLRCPPPRLSQYSTALRSHTWHDCACQGTPSDLELELLDDMAQPLATSRFGAALEQVTANLSAGMQPVDQPGRSVADGMEVVARWLNSLPEDALAGW